VCVGEEGGGGGERHTHTHTNARTHTRSEVQCNGGTRKVVGEVLSSSPAYAWLFLLGGKAKKAKVSLKGYLQQASIYIIMFRWAPTLSLLAFGIREGPVMGGPSGFEIPQGW
jgi:hypothetical protein